MSLVVRRTAICAFVACILVGKSVRAWMPPRRITGLTGTGSPKTEVERAVALPRGNPDMDDSPKAGGEGDIVPSDASKYVVDVVKGGINLFFRDRPYARFYALETVARVPYFAYLSVLHLFETLGRWREVQYLQKEHFEESWNEMHHLLIMESLGGSEQFADRFVAMHMAVFYYWIAVGLYMLEPTAAYNINQAVEQHAFDTYDDFLRTHERELRTTVAPQVALDYYQTGTFEDPFGRRPQRIESLYDVFLHIREDEGVHASSMAASQQAVQEKL